MDKRTSICILLLFICQSAFSQLIKPEKRSFIGFNVGIALPSGSYRNASQINSAPSLAGYGINLEAAGYILPYIGLSASCGFFQNPLNEAKAEAANNGKNVHAAKWINTYALLGPVFSLPMKKITVDFRVLLGIININKPALDYRNSYNTGLCFSEVRTNSVAYSFGGSIRYKFMHRCALKFNVDYFYADAFVNDNGAYYFSGNPFALSESFSQNLEIRSFNLGLGIVLQLVK